MRGGRRPPPLLVLAALAPPAEATNGVRVTINGANGGFLDAATVFDARDEPLDTRAARRRSDGTTTIGYEGGTRLATVVELAHVPRALVKDVLVPRVSTPGSVQITGEELRRGFSGDPSGQTGGRPSDRGPLPCEFLGSR